MNRAQLVPTASPRSGGSVGAVRPGAAVGMGTVDTTEINVVVGCSMDQAREEVNDAFRDMEEFHSMEPDEIMRRAGGHSARLSYIRVRIMRVEDYARHWKDVRVRELEPALEQLKHQFDIASRLHTVREFDYKIETGER